MIHEWLEELHDTLWYFGIMLGMLFFFLIYWKGEYQLRYAEIVMQEFLTDASVNGKITLDEYEELIGNLERVNSEYSVDIQCIKYRQEPIYAVFSEEEIAEYYLSRNTRKEAVWQPIEISVEEEPENSLKLQTETNASVMAAKDKEYVPLPEEASLWRAEAVRPVQEVYEGEELITICQISSPEGNYYAEAEPLTAQTSGTVMLQLNLDNKRYQIPVEVVCYPRTVKCENGHKIINDRNVVREYKESGKIICPYCKVLPESISCNTSVIYKETGTRLTEEEVWITVVYLDGHTETVTPKAKEWQDSYDENYCGIQEVVINYFGKEAVVTVLTENKACKQCGKACNERCFEDYRIFPYCIGCMSQAALYSGKVFEEEQRISANEMVAYLDLEQELLLCRGDFIILFLVKGEECISLLQRTILQDGRVGDAG